MKILISNVVWGKQHCNLLLNFSIASLLAPNNIPKISKNYDITLQIITTKIDYKFLNCHPVIQRACEYCKIDWQFMESFGWQRHTIPVGYGQDKYAFLSQMQNIAVQTSLDFDFIVFNYSDFIWSENSMSNIVSYLNDEIDAVLGFCVPVDMEKGISELDCFRVKNRLGESLSLEIGSRQSAELLHSNMHREALLRYWNGPMFSMTPTYIMWPVDDEGIILRAYHQTILIMKVRAKDPSYYNGISGTSLDGHFVDEVAKRGRYKIASNSDEAIVFSLYETNTNTAIGGPSWGRDSGKQGLFDREASVELCLQSIVSLEQRPLASEAFQIRRKYSDFETWNAVSKESAKIIETFNENVLFNQESYDNAHSNENDKSTNTTIIQRLANKSKDNLEKASRGFQPILKFCLNENLYKAVRQYYYVLFSLGDVPSSSGRFSEIEGNLQNVKYLDKLLSRPRKLGKVRSLVVEFETSYGVASSYGDVRINLFETNRVLVKYLQSYPFCFHGRKYLARNLWFQGRFDESLYEFQQVEMLRNAEKEKLNPDSNYCIFLPSNTPEVIGLIGHLDSIVKRKILSNDPKKLMLVVFEDSKVINHVFLEYWSSYVQIITEKEYGKDRLKQYMNTYEVDWHWYMPDAKGRYSHSHNSMAQIQGQWLDESREPLLSTYPKHEEVFHRETRKLGLKLNDWFVCFHLRSNGFYNETADDSAQNFRNIDVEPYLDSMRLVLEMGGWVFRMGDSSMPQIESSVFGDLACRFIDYAHSSSKSEILDVMLSAKCKLFVSGPSGLHTVAHAFGVKVCMTNFPMYPGVPWHSDDIYLPIRYRYKNSKLPLGLQEIFDNQIYFADQEPLLSKLGVETFSCESDVIHDAIKDFLDPKPISRDKELQFQKVNKLFAILNKNKGFNTRAKIEGNYSYRYGDELLQKKPAKQSLIKASYTLDPVLEKKALSPLLDVVVPTYNRPFLLYRLLKSSMEHSVPGMRIVVIDDCSTKKEFIPGLGDVDVKDICEYFSSSRIVYIRNEKNIGVAGSWVKYYQDYCDVPFTLSMTDKDTFINSEPIINAIKQLEADTSLGMVVIPLEQQDRTSKNTKLYFDYIETVSGSKFIDMYVQDTKLQHCSMWSVIRVESIHKSGAPRPMGLTQLGLDDGFGIDIDLIFNVAKTSRIGFQTKPHILRSTLAGGTEKYPLTFAYTYYQYAQRVMLELYSEGLITKAKYRYYLKWWILLICRGLDVSYSHVHNTEMEVGDARISKHLDRSIWIFIPMECLKHRLLPNIEMFSRLINAAWNKFLRLRSFNWLFKS